MPAGLNPRGAMCAAHVARPGASRSCGRTYQHRGRYDDEADDPCALWHKPYLPPGIRRTLLRRASQRQGWTGAVGNYDTGLPRGRWRHRRGVRWRLSAPAGLYKECDYGHVGREGGERGRSRGPDRSLLRFLEGRAQAHGQGVQGGQAHRLGCGPDVLRGPRDLPRPVGGGVGSGADGRLRHGQAPHEPGGRGARAGAGDPHERDHEPAGRGQRIGSCLRHRSWGRGLGVLGLRQRLHERLQLDPRRRRRRVAHEDPARADRPHAGADGAGRHHRHGGDAHGRSREGGRRRGRSGRHGRGRMGHRQVARAPVPRERPAGGALLGRAERQAPVPPVLARGPVWPWWAG